MPKPTFLKTSTILSTWDVGQGWFKWTHLPPWHPGTRLNSSTPSGSSRPWCHAFCCGRRQDSRLHAICKNVTLSRTLVGGSRPGGEKAVGFRSRQGFPAVSSGSWWHYFGQGAPATGQWVLAEKMWMLGLAARGGERCTLKAKGSRVWRGNWGFPDPLPLSLCTCSCLAGYEIIPSLRHGAIKLSSCFYLCNAGRIFWLPLRYTNLKMPVALANEKKKHEKIKMLNEPWLGLDLI